MTFDSTGRPPDLRPARWLAAKLARPNGCVALALIALGVFLRLHSFAFPPTFLFDEHHFVDNARNYLHHLPDTNDHPPAGKLLIAASMRVFGDNPVGWRAPALLSGAIVLLAGGLAAARLFGSAGAGLITTALLAADGFLIGYSRVGLLDGYLAACAMLALWLATLAWTAPTALVAGSLAGVAASIKFSGGAVLVPLIVAIETSALATRRRKAALASAVLASSVVAYVALFAFGLRMAHQPASPGDVMRETRRLLARHAALTDMNNPWVSSWATWFVPTRPLMLGHVIRTGSVRVLNSLGNLAVWWASAAVALALGWTIMVRGLAATVGAAGDARHRATVTPVVGEADADADEPGAAGFIRDHGRATVLVLSTALAFLAPWILTRRDSYIYHFLPSYTTLVLLLGGVLGSTEARRPSAVLFFLLLVLLVACFYAPVWSFFPLDDRAVRQRLFVGTWR